MKRFTTLLIILAIAALIGWLAFAAPASVEPATVAADKVTPGQEAYARSLNAGIFYEQNAILDQAETAYKKAAESAQVEIASAANTNLQRLALEQKDFFFNLRLSTRTSTLTLAQTLINLGLAILVILILWQIVGLLPRRPGYLLEPFDDLTADSAGKHFHTQIARQLAEIRQIQVQAKDQLFNSLERLDFPLVSPEIDIPADVLSLLDTTKIGQVNLPLSGAVQAIRKWLNRRAYTIEGAIEPRGKALSIHFQITRNRDHIEIYHGDLTTINEGSSADQLQAAAEEAAFRIVYALCQPQVQANSWRSMQLFIQGLALMQQGQEGGFQPEILARSYAALLQCTKIDPGYQQALFAQGLVLVNQGKYQESQEIFSRVINWNSENTPLRLAALYNLGLACYHTYRRQRFEKGETAFNEVLDHFQKTLPTDEWTTSLWALAHCGLMSIEAQRLRPLLMEKISINRSENEKRTQTDNELSQKVSENRTEIEKNILTHIEMAQKLAGSRPDVQAAIHFSQGVLKMGSGKVEDAIEEFKQCLAHRSDYIEAYIYLAILKFDLKDEEEAIRLLKQTEDLKLPGNEYAMYRLGDIYERLKNLDAAQNAYLLAPNIPEACFASGKIYFAESDRVEALDQFRAATVLNSRSALYWDYLCWAIIHPTLLDKNLLKEALAAAERMLQLAKNTPDEWRGRDMLGWIAFYQSEMTRSVRELTLSIHLGEHKQNYYHLAKVWLVSGNLKKARECVIKSLNISEPDSHWQERAVNLLHDIDAAQSQANQTVPNGKLGA